MAEIIKKLPPKHLHTSTNPSTAYLDPVPLITNLGTLKNEQTRNVLSFITHLF